MYHAQMELKPVLDGDRRETDFNSGVQVGLHERGLVEDQSC